MDVSEALSCKICFTPFDSDQHAPRLVPGCWQHTLCTRCIRAIFEKSSLSNFKMFKCPFDNITVKLPRADLSCFPKNLELIAMIEEVQQISQQLKGGKCKVHNQNFDYICLDHKYPICLECSKMEIHANHKIRMTTHLIQEQKDKAKLMEDMIKNIEGHQQTMEKQSLTPGNPNSQITDELSRRVIAWKKKAIEKLCKLEKNGLEELDLDIIEEDTDKILDEVAEWAKRVKSGFTYTLMAFFLSHNLKNEDIDIKDVLIEPKMPKRKSGIQAKKETVWGFFKNWLQLEETAQTHVKEEPEPEEDALKRMRKLELGYNLG